ncbi:MAG: DUF359 domain-containing protein [Candidatus Micrarchaeota archaeon]|nr:DUF359 domain-containing protein [Candidatus Micrarchaeota archaeon]
MLILPEKMREGVRKPFGTVFGGSTAMEAARLAARPLISVGDQCATDLIDAGIAPDILIFDFKIKREEISVGMKKKLALHAKSAFVVLSGAGMISDELEIAVLRVLENGKGAVMVAGEDDLSSLLVMAHAKQGTLVYGQPNEGAVVVPLGGKEIMEKARALLGRMEKK